MSDVWEKAEIIPRTRFTHGFKRMCVYGWFRHNECLYIGCTDNVWQRLASHHKIDKVEPILPQDQIRLIWIDGSGVEGLQLESYLIELHAPKYNSNGGYYPVQSNRPLKTIKCRCGSTFKQRQWWQKTCSKKCMKLKPTRAELLQLL